MPRKIPRVSIIPLFVFHAHEKIVVGDASIVDENIDLADRVLRILDKLDYRAAVAKIAR